MNNISIDGDVAIAFSENIKKRFESYGWNVIDDVNGHNFTSIEQSITNAKKQQKKPTVPWKNMEATKHVHETNKDAIPSPPTPTDSECCI